MRPGWVHSFYDYWVWAERLLEQTGGWLDDAFLAVDVLLEDEDDQASPPLALHIQRQRLHFPDGSYLSFALAVNDDLEAIDYSFHYALANDEIVWRYDKHLGHEDEDGGDTHVHLGPDERRRPYREVGLGEVLEWAQEDQDRRREAV